MIFVNADDEIVTSCFIFLPGCVFLRLDQLCSRHAAQMLLLTLWFCRVAVRRANQTNLWCDFAAETPASAPFGAACEHKLVGSFVGRLQLGIHKPRPLSLKHPGRPPRRIS